MEPLQRITIQARTVVLSQQNTMAFFRQYIAPLFIVLIFLVALLAVTARAFLPADMAQPAPTEEVGALSQPESQPLMSPRV
jgi:hypothetical protein